MKTTQYGIWQKADEGDDGYWALYDKLEDAVSSEGDGVKVYELRAEYLGQFTREVRLVKVKKCAAKNTK